MTKYSSQVLPVEQSLVDDAYVILPCVLGVMQLISPITLQKFTSADETSTVRLPSFT